MKKAFFALVVTMAVTGTVAQDTKKDQDGKKHGFKKENIFTGGGIDLSFSNYTTVLGASPIFGYSICNWLDAALVFNYNYSSDRHAAYYDPNTFSYYYSNDKLRQTIIGPGLMLRAYPVKFLFVQVQGEENFMMQKLIPADGSGTQRTNFSAVSCLVGAGYCNGREGRGSLFYYVSILADVAKNKNSPYVEQSSSGSINVLPIIRAGLQVPLFQGKRR